MSRYLSNDFGLKYSWLVALFLHAGAAVAAPAGKRPCDDDNLIKATINLLIEVNKIDAAGLSFAISDIKPVQSKNHKILIQNKRNVVCLARLNVLKDQQTLDALDLEYGEIYSAKEESKIFFNPIRNQK